MKITKTEKFVIAAIIVVVIVMIVNVIMIKEAVKESGGLKSLIIEAGRELKDIDKEINKEEEIFEAKKEIAAVVVEVEKEIKEVKEAIKK